MFKSIWNYFGGYILLAVSFLVGVSIVAIYGFEALGPALFISAMLFSVFIIAWLVISSFKEQLERYKDHQLVEQRKAESKEQYDRFKERLERKSQRFNR